MKLKFFGDKAPDNRPDDGSKPRGKLAALTALVALGGLGQVAEAGA